MPKPKLTVTVSNNLVTTLDKIVAHHRPFVTRHTVHRAALQLGLWLFEIDPSRLSKVIQGHVSKERSASPEATEPLTSGRGQHPKGAVGLEGEESESATESRSGGPTATGETSA